MKKCLKVDLDSRELNVFEAALRTDALPLERA